MAAIIKRGNKYAVVYRYADASGEEKQKWESFASKQDAKKRKAEVEDQILKGTLVPPCCDTLDSLMQDYIQSYGLNTWAVSTYESKLSLYKHYIQPLIGDKKLKDLTPRAMDKYFLALQKVKTVTVNHTKPKSEYVTPHTMLEIKKFLSSAFKQAVKWELMGRNPVANVNLPKYKKKEREIWTSEQIHTALDACEDDMLALAINLSFTCTLRVGEILGLTWDCINIAPEAIEAGEAFLIVNKELQRANRNCMEELSDKDIILKFPQVNPSNSTCLILKTPKTQSSVRKVFIPRSVADMLTARYQEILELKDLLGDEFHDYNLVLCNTNGRPLETSYIQREMKKLIKKTGLPKVVFHSLRHSSITYKLKLNGGDMKSVQGDSGHAQMTMVAEVYSHIIDEDRKKNAERMEKAFYANNRSITNDTSTDKSKQNTLNIEETRSQSKAEIIEKLLDDPEAAALLKMLASKMQ